MPAAIAGQDSTLPTGDARKSECFRVPALTCSPALSSPVHPDAVSRVPEGRAWVHEIKHRQAACLFTRNGFDWSHRYPVIVEAAGSLRVRSIAIDGEVVVCGNDGVSDFDRLHSQGWDSAVSVFLYAFDLLELDGEDMRQDMLEARKGRLEKVLGRAKAGIQFVEHTAELDDDHVRARLQARAPRHRVEAAEFPLPQRQIEVAAEICTGR
jgi:ATP-dependent DNA ligase